MSNKKDELSSSEHREPWIIATKSSMSNWVPSGVHCLAALLLGRLLLTNPNNQYGGCSAPEAFVYCTCVVMIGLYALYGMYLKDKKAEPIPNQASAYEGLDEDFSELRNDVDELKTRVNALVLKDGLKL